MLLIAGEELNNGFPIVSKPIGPFKHCPGLKNNQYVPLGALDLTEIDTVIGVIVLFVKTSL